MLYLKRFIFGASINLGHANPGYVKPRTALTLDRVKPYGQVKFSIILTLESVHFFGQKSTTFLIKIRKIFSLILTVELHPYRAGHVMFLPNRVVEDNLITPKWSIHSTQGTPTAGLQFQEYSSKTVHG